MKKMETKILILILALNSVQVLGTCDTTRCTSIPVHYHELGCKPIIKDGECCPSSFDCSHLDAQDASKCHFKGIAINDGDLVDQNLLKYTCVGSAFCSSQGRFVYAVKDCAEFFGPKLQPGCVRQYANDKCCSIGSVCGDEALKLATCKFEGKTYKEGERMYPINHICHKCLCTNDFENKPVTQNKDCLRVECSLELKETDNIRNKCVPIYHPDSCCPYNWACPKSDDAIIPGNNSQTSSSAKCKFGSLELNIGDVLSTKENNCFKCSCNVPPMLDCIFAPGC